MSCHRVPIPAAGWQRWEAELGAGRLLGPEGFIAAGPREHTAAAMEAAGAAFSWLDRREIAARIPFVAAPWEHGVLDPLGGSLRIRRALTALARRVDIHRAEVASVAGDGPVTLADGTVVRRGRGVRPSRPSPPSSSHGARTVTQSTWPTGETTGRARTVQRGLSQPVAEQRCELHEVAASDELPRT